MSTVAGTEHPKQHGDIERDCVWVAHSPVDCAGRTILLGEESRIPVSDGTSVKATIWIRSAGEEVTRLPDTRLIPFVKMVPGKAQSQARLRAKAKQ